MIENGRCKENEHNFIKVAEERRQYLDENWNTYYRKVYRQLLRSRS